MTPEQLHAWLRFSNAELSPRAAHALLDRFGTPEAVFNAGADEIETVPELTSEQLRRLYKREVEPSDAQLEAAQRPDVSVITRDDPDYPHLLRDVADRPPVLYVRGRLDERDRFAVAIVGTRRPTPYGRAVAARFGRGLSDLGLTVVSGGALGVDTAAHRAVVKARGRTIVVLGCGLNVRYPADNQDLFDQIVAEDAGAIVTEFPFGASPDTWRFPLRNRVISGMSLGVVVVEAGAQSGALITASYAGDQGREVMAVPGNIDSECSAGTNALIRDGAALVTNAREVAEAVGVLVLRSPDQPAATRPAPEISDADRELLSHLSLTPQHIDKLVETTGQTASQLSAQLTVLELRGLVHRTPGGGFIRTL
jgi:DNA processing protein